jgi:hypothetical protein
MDKNNKFKSYHYLMSAAIHICVIASSREEKWYRVNARRGNNLCTLYQMTLALLTDLGIETKFVGNKITAKA